MAAVLILDSEGKRVVARYYKSNFTSSTEELAFEKKLFDKTVRTNAKSEGAHALRCFPNYSMSEMQTPSLTHSCL